MKQEVRTFLEEIKANPSSGMSRDAKMTIAQVEAIFAIDKLTEEVGELKENLAKYSTAANK